MKRARSRLRIQADTRLIERIMILKEDHALQRLAFRTPIERRYTVTVKLPELPRDLE